MSHSRKNVQEVSKQNSEESEQIKDSSPRIKYGKTDVRYWKQRLFHNSYTRDGKLHEVPEWSIKIQYLGVRETFALASTNKEVAAAKARDIYQTLVGKGWDAAREMYNPTMVQRRDDPTVGEFLADVEAKANIRPKTFRGYASCLRTIVASVFGITAGAERFDHKHGGNKEWRSKIDAVRLASLIPAKMQAWKISFLRKAEGNPAAQLSRNRTFNTYLRGVRCLFSPKRTKFLTVRLPNPLPFEGITKEKSGSTRYVSTIDPVKIVAAARAELREQRPESYKAFLLGFLIGLRRAEMDNLEWTAFRWNENNVVIQNTDVLRVKTDGSEAVIAVDEEVMRELAELKLRTKSRFVLESKLPPRPDLNRQYYRCQRHFNHLLKWLRGKGVNSRKPLHELRKEFGSQINMKYGLVAAKDALRHTDISTSARHYVANKQRITMGLGNLLNGLPMSNTQEAKAAA